MSDDQGESTISLSLVDGISCGLAAALLLLIVFGINVSATIINVGGGAGNGTIVTKVRSDFRGEPVDIVVEVAGAVGAGDGSPGWGPLGPSAPQDHVVDNVDENSKVFVRELPHGLTTPDGVHATQEEVAFNLRWKGPNPPRGKVHFFRSGRDDVFEFKCGTVSASYELIRGFDFAVGPLDGACKFSRVE